MNRYWKLLNWEMNRFAKFYGVLWLVTLLSQFTGIFLYANAFMNRVHATIQDSSLSEAEYATHFETASFESFSKSFWFVAPIALCIATLLLYVFLIWYREWFGKSTFIYRLLMLPTSRMNVYLAKTSAIFLFVLGLVAFQLLILIPEIQLFNYIIPSELRDSVSVAQLIRDHPLMNILIPQYFIQFILYYGAGLMGVIVVFTAILLERSFKLKGMLAGVIYGVTVGFVLFLPILISVEWYPDFFYPSEIVMMEIAAGLLIICSSLWFSFYLLRKKITV
ncbi:hypothetical protein DNHGIG_24080 [Collibacillus ludicampi]|uniref:ABC transporter permease n=1 Tax=Collibacillus ludicampi TaxID=2771369 RepID=A0AAV4LGA6_9BACL|nr:hypothetical protein [Collibacillus ludicampi]GIM46859.1 hypothetical protein DNHGIG_24080 [Collibacillus ludicampi]